VIWPHDQKAEDCCSVCFPEDQGQVPAWRLEVSEQDDTGRWHLNAVDVHTYFSLTYSNYLVLHRSILQSMPMDWQPRFTEVMREVDAAVESAGLNMPASCTVRWRDDKGKFVSDPIPHYNRGRTDVLGNVS
jgi:hypothetical protein